MPASPPPRARSGSGVTSGIASLIVALLAPVLGAIADRSSSRVRLLLMCTVLGAAATPGSRWSPQGHWLGAAALLRRWLRSASGAASSSTTRCCCTWPSRDEYDLVSGFGYALGYLGGGLLFALNVFMTLRPAIVRAGRRRRSGALVVRHDGYLVVRVRAAVRVASCKEKAVGDARGRQRWLRSGAARLRRTAHGTLGEIRRYKPLMLFLAAYVLYIDGVNTVIKMAIDYGLSLGFDQARPGQGAAADAVRGVSPRRSPSAGSGARIGARNGIFIALAVYVAATLLRLLPR